MIENIKTVSTKDLKKFLLLNSDRFSKEDIRNELTRRIPLNVYTSQRRFTNGRSVTEQSL